MSGFEIENIIKEFDVYIKKISKRQSNILKISIISTFSSLISLLILFAQDLEVIVYVLPIVTTLTMIGIVILFILMYKIKRLSQAHGLIIGLGFFLIIISSLFRPSLTKGFDILMLITAELIDTAIYILIFIGFIKKPPYFKDSLIEIRKIEEQEISV